MLTDRYELLQAFAGAPGAPVPRELLGLAARDVQALAQLAAAALVAKKHAQAERAFAALAVLEPGEPTHLLHLAHACAAAKNVDGVCRAVARLLELDVHVAPDDIVRALLLRAEVTATSDRKRAEEDLLAARIIAGKSQAAQRVLEGAR